MKRSLKILSLALCLVLVLSMLAACGTKPKDNTLPEGAGLFVDGVKYENDKVMTVNGVDISLELFRYYYLYIKSQLDGGDQAVWENQEYVSALSEYALNMVKSYVTTEVMAKNEKVTLDSEDLKNVDQQYNDAIEQMGGEDTFKATLEKAFCTPELFYDQIRNAVLQEKVFKTLYEDEFRKELDEAYVRATHILVAFPTPEYEAATPDENATDEEKAAIEEENAKKLAAAQEVAKAEAKVKAEEVLAKVNAGDDFEKLIEEYNEDPGMAKNEEGYYDGYYFTDGTMVQEFQDAAYALEENATSGLVETSYGYHIIKRLPMEEKYINDNLIKLMADSKVYTSFTEQADKVFGELEIVYDDSYEKINPTSLK